MSGTVVAGQELTSALLGVPNWTPMTLLNGWTNFGGGNPDAQFRVWPLLNSIEIIGCIAAGTLTTGTIIATLTSVPASGQDVGIFATGAGNVTAGMPHLNVDTSGNLKTEALPTGTTVVSFHQFISLDA